MARSRKMATVARTGSRLEQLKNLAGILAKQIDLCEKNKDGLKILFKTNVMQGGLSHGQTSRV